VHVVRYCVRASFPAIKTSKRRSNTQHDRSLKRAAVKRGETSAGRESTPTRVRRGEEGNRGEETGFRSALLRIERSMTSDRRTGNPRSAAGSPGRSRERFEW